MKLRFTMDPSFRASLKMAGKRTCGSDHGMLHAIWYVAMTIFAFVMTLCSMDRPDGSPSSALCVSLLAASPPSSSS